jgi:hypothetical protein
VSGDTSWTHSGDAQATSSAVASGAGEAHAWAFAIGGRAPRVGDSVGTGGDATASASAVSDTGPATAEVLETGGSGAFGGGTIQIVLPAGAGRASLATDAVSGATAGLLTLRQTARGGDGGDGLKPGPGGAAESDLHATNPGGGALLAESIAIGGSAGSAGDDRGNPTTYLPDGAAALATVVATDQVGASVSALASAQGGTAGSSLFFGYHGLGGSATANALAIGLGEVTAAATALAPHGGATHATSEAQRSGPIAAARVDASLPVGDVARAYAPRRDLEARAGIATGAPSAAILADSAAATWTAAPNAGDAASWLSGNPNAAASGMDVLALGSLANRIQTGNPNLSGTLELDLTTADFAPGTRLALALLDPSAVGLGLSFLHLSFSNDGAVSFETSFADTGSALAGLDDVVVDVGTLAATSDSLRRLVLSFELDLGDAGFGQEAGFAFDFALLASAAPAPEPGSLSLLGVAGAALLFAVRKAR